MESFELNGKIISREQIPISNLDIEAYDEDPILKPDDFLGDSVTDSKGKFTIEFDRSKFDDFWEALDGTPDVFLLVKDDKNQDLMKTREVKTKKEIEYHIRVDPGVPNPNAPDHYSGNARRMLDMLTEVGDMIGIEYRINLDLLSNGDLDNKTKEDINEFVNSYQDRRYNFDQLVVILSSLVDSLAEEARVGGIGYDGPQVPRRPRRESYDQVIIWPRQEAFKWA